MNHSMNVYKLPEESDIFCWKCHTLNVHVACSTCDRSFHKQCCSNQIKYEHESWRCFECAIGEKAAKNPKFTSDELKKLLALALDRCNVNMPNAQLHDHDIPRLPTRVRPMNLDIIADRLNANQYATTAAFLSDLKWIEHQLVVSAIYYSTQHREPRKSDVLHLCRNMLRIAESDIREIEQCAHCFHRRIMREPGWFLCQASHTLIWAKVKGQRRYYPAKAMGLNPAGTLVDVQFFGRHNSAWVPMNQCYLFAREPPMSFADKAKRTRNDFLPGMMEVKAYIRKYTQVYGQFEFAEQNVLYHSKKTMNTNMKRSMPQVNAVPGHLGMGAAAVRREQPILIDEVEINEPVDDVEHNNELNQEEI